MDSGWEGAIGLLELPLDYCDEAIDAVVVQPRSWIVEKSELFFPEKSKLFASRGVKAVRGV